MMCGLSVFKRLRIFLYLPVTELAMSLGGWTFA